MLCRLMHLSRSSFYFWLKSLQSPCKQKLKLAAIIKELIELHNQYPSHGYRWLRAKLELDKKIHVSDGYVLKCCRIAGIQSQAKHRRRKYHGSSNRKYPNVLLAGFNLTRPFQCIVSDMTPFWSHKKYYELTTYVDLWNNEIISHSLSKRRGDRMTYIAGKNSVLQQKMLKANGCEMILHTDQGSVYASEDFNKKLDAQGIVRSMSRAGTPTDNGQMESLNGWMKDELFTDLHITGNKPINEEIDDYIKFFNEERPACCLGYLTPKQYREKYHPETKGWSSTNQSSYDNV